MNCWEIWWRGKLIGRAFYKKGTDVNTIYVNLTRHQGYPFTITVKKVKP